MLRKKNRLTLQIVKIIDSRPDNYYLCVLKDNSPQWLKLSKQNKHVKEYIEKVKNVDFYDLSKPLNIWSQNSSSSSGQKRASDIILDRPQKKRKI